jgi:hypothetical protein
MTFRVATSSESGTQSCERHDESRSRFARSVARDQLELLEANRGTTIEAHEFP